MQIFIKEDDKVLVMGKDVKATFLKAEDLTTLQALKDEIAPLVVKPAPTADELAKEDADLDKQIAQKQAELDALTAKHEAVATEIATLPPRIG